ncbi:MAG: hypothetical protein KAZ18_01625 [Acinetobacter sp.]|uniref:hypothetical protein n=1 Tax=Acinetobacter sp. NIPH 298 TaxID=1217692 RepID=UPI0002D0B718|nr:hypothetical protein [Acinetobacter sp. NIPH 298]ENW96895.1 hypothetical protein F903_00708 [Acinetobacter sp. NIPH 298]MBP8005583.1 hypothetical protein [Acinetobacter sp.]
MDREKIEQIRNELSIPLIYAIKLLNENQNNVSAAVNNFHKENIEKVIQATKCNTVIAQEIYQNSNFDVEKSIRKIKSHVITLTTRENQQRVKNEIGFIVWAESQGKKTNTNDIFIPIKDFDYILKAFQEVLASDRQSSFAMCGDNYFDRETSLFILNEIQKIQINNPQINDFLETVINWWSEQLIDAEFIVVYGNL